MWKTKDHNVSETGSVSALRWMGQDKPTQLGPLERASLSHWTQWPLQHWWTLWTHSRLDIHACLNQYKLSTPEVVNQSDYSYAM
jgi:hypothetical protein